MLCFVASALLVLCLAGLSGMASSLGAQALQDSGYIKLSNRVDTHYFYWYFESRREPSTDPLILWIPGGPGEGGTYGLLAENGPCTVNSDHSTTINPFSWTAQANMVWIDVPANSGFSYSTVAEDDELTDERVVESVFSFLQGFFRKHPELQGRELFIVVFTHFANITDNRYKIFFVNGTQEAAMKAAVPECRRLMTTCQSNTSVCGEAGSFCQRTQLMPLLQAHRNPYDIRQVCATSTSNTSACMGKFPYVKAYLDSPDLRTFLGVRPSIGGWVPLNRTINAAFFKAPSFSGYKSMGNKVSELLEAGLRVLFYAGDADLLCNIYAIEATVERLIWSGTAGFNAAQERSYSTTSGIGGAGSVRSHSHLTKAMFFAADDEGQHSHQHFLSLLRGLEVVYFFLELEELVEGVFEIYDQAKNEERTMVEATVAVKLKYPALKMAADVGFVLLNNFPGNFWRRANEAVVDFWKSFATDGTYKFVRLPHLYNTILEIKIDNRGKLDTFDVSGPFIGLLDEYFKSRQVTAPLVFAWTCWIKCVTALQGNAGLSRSSNAQKQLCGLSEVYQLMVENDKSVFGGTSSKAMLVKAADVCSKELFQTRILSRDMLTLTNDLVQNLSEIVDALSQQQTEPVENAAIMFVMPFLDGLQRDGSVDMGALPGANRRMQVGSSAAMVIKSIAAIAGHEDIARIILEADNMIDLNTPTFHSKETLVHLTVKNNHRSMFYQLCLFGADIYIKDGNERRVCDVTTDRKWHHELEILVEACPHPNRINTTDRRVRTPVATEAAQIIHVLQKFHRVDHAAIMEPALDPVRKLRETTPVFANFVLSTSKIFASVDRKSQARDILEVLEKRLVKTSFAPFFVV
uniref:Uncharacterized protein n=1 Tax=Phytophthora ramorum TaxID=164328 RepID=H3HBT2_PHYRM